MSFKEAKSKPATIHDIAVAAGVAPMTVSRALSGKGYVSDEVRTKVLATARRLRYRPNGVARSLRRQSTKAVGILLPDMANPYSSELVHGVEGVLNSHGYDCFITASLRDVAREKRALAAFLEHRVDGILVATRETPTGNEALIEAVERGTPVVCVGRQLAHPRIDRVTADHGRGAFALVEHLIGLGHRDIGFLGATMAHQASLSRFAGYVDALREHGLDVRPEWMAGPSAESPAYSTQEDGYAGMRFLLGAGSRPTAVLCRNDFTAIGAICAAIDLGLPVPREMAIAGFDNIPISAYTQPPLTTVEQPTAEQGRLAGQMLVERLTREYEGERREIVLPCQLVVRKSCGASASGGPAA